MQKASKLESARSALTDAEGLQHTHRIGTHSSNLTMVFSLARTIITTVEGHHLNRSTNEHLALNVCQTIKVSVGALNHQGIEEDNQQYVILDRLCSIVTRVKDYLEAHYQRNALNRLFSSNNSPDAEHSKILNEELEATRAIATQAIERLGGRVSPFRMSESYEASIRSSISLPNAMPTSNPLPSPTIQIRMPTAEVYVAPQSNFSPPLIIGNEKIGGFATEEPEQNPQPEIPPPYVNMKTRPSVGSPSQMQRPLPEIPTNQSQNQGLTPPGSPMRLFVSEEAQRQALTRSLSTSSELTYCTVPSDGSPGSSRGATPCPPTPPVPSSPTFPTPTMGGVKIGDKKDPMVA